MTRYINATTGVEVRAGFEPAHIGFADLRVTASPTDLSMKGAFSPFLRPRRELNPRIEVLQTSALPLGYAAGSASSLAGS